MMTIEQIEALIADKEGETLEFKEARNHFEFDNLVKYCCAIANEGGGYVVFGVTDKRPRTIVGSQAFSQPERTRRGLCEQLPLRIDFSEILHPKGRVLVFHVPARPVGTPIKAKGIYWARQNDSLAAMSEEDLRAIFAESGYDFSADLCHKARFSDLMPEAIDNFRQRWIVKSGNTPLANLSDAQLLADAEAIVEGKITYAALVLFGTREVLGRHLGQAEVVFEYRSSEASGPAQQRKEYRQGFFSFYDNLWETINLRNDLQHFQEGLFVLDIPTFAERSVREAILNAVSHRDYQLGGSVFIRQYSRRLVIESPGGLPVGITLENILDRQSPRNRRIADIFAKCGLVERSGQGMNLIFEESIQASKPAPDFLGTDRYNVVLTLNGQVQNPGFLRFLEKIGREKLKIFTTQDFLILDLIHQEKPIPPKYDARLQALRNLGVIEAFGRGRGRRFILARRFYAMARKKGVYTWKRGLDRETNKELLLKHIRENAREGSRLYELMQVLPTCSRNQVQSLLRQLMTEGVVYKEGRTKGALWHPTRIASDNTSKQGE